MGVAQFAILWDIERCDNQRDALLSHCKRPIWNRTNGHMPDAHGRACALYGFLFGRRAVVFSVDKLRRQATIQSYESETHTQYIKMRDIWRPGRDLL